MNLLLEHPHWIPDAAGGMWGLSSGWGAMLSKTSKSQGQA